MCNVSTNTPSPPLWDHQLTTATHTPGQTQPVIQPAFVFFFWFNIERMVRLYQQPPMIINFCVRTTTFCTQLVPQLRYLSCFSSNYLTFEVNFRLSCLRTHTNQWESFNFVTLPVLTDGISHRKYSNHRMELDWGLTIVGRAVCDEQCGMERARYGGMAGVQRF
jgi:hypothetical protein